MNWYIKTAGIAQAPPLLVDAVMDAIDQFNQSNERETVVSIPIDLTGWKYGGNELVEAFAKKKRQEAEERLIPIWNGKGVPTVMREEFFKGRSDDEMAGEMENQARHLRVQLTKAPNDWVNKSTPASWMASLKFMNILTTARKDKMRNYIEHETIHFAQDFFSVAKGTEDTFGPPRRAKMPQFSGSQDYANYYNRDVEFQPWVITFTNELDSWIDAAKKHRGKIIRKDVIGEFERFIKKRLGAMISPKREIMIKELYKHLEQNMDRFLA